MLHVRSGEVTQVSAGVREIASVAAFAADLNERQTVMVALALQKNVNAGMLQGKVVTGDHDENGTTVQDWEEL